MAVQGELWWEGGNAPHVVSRLITTQLSVSPFPHLPISSIPPFLPIVAVAVAAAVLLANGAINSEEERNTKHYE